ncbi:hypothetical protein D3C81_1962480 [compost metagenome]
MLQHLARQQVGEGCQFIIQALAVGEHTALLLIQLLRSHQAGLLRGIQLLMQGSGLLLQGQ